jgi:LmbE family N-acetylglucosaminyl deacetylase
MSSPVLTPLELPKSGTKVLVITAHPDDVVLVLAELLQH